MRHRVIEAVQYAVKHVNRWFVGAQQREPLIHAVVSAQDRATGCTRGGVGADSTRLALGQPTEGGRLQLTDGGVSCLECL
jgi:hypothetical protein